MCLSVQNPNTSPRANGVMKQGGQRKVSGATRGIIRPFPSFWNEQENWKTVMLKFLDILLLPFTIGHYSQSIIQPLSPSPPPSVHMVDCPRLNVILDVWRWKACFIVHPRAVSLKQTSPPQQVSPSPSPWRSSSYPLLHASQKS